MNRNAEHADLTDFREKKTAFQLTAIHIEKGIRLVFSMYYSGY